MRLVDRDHANTFAVRRPEESTLGRGRATAAPFIQHTRKPRSTRLAAPGPSSATNPLGVSKHESRCGEGFLRHKGEAHALLF